MPNSMGNLVAGGIDFQCEELVDGAIPLVNLGRGRDARGQARGRRSVVLPHCQGLWFRRGKGKGISVR